MDYQAMTDAMLETMAAFPADTEGVGNQNLEPTEVLADGTKVFDLTMELGDWEVERRATSSRPGPSTAWSPHR